MQHYSLIQTAHQNEKTLGKMPERH
jgi:hypothetical protein